MKRFISVILSLAMVIALIPCTVSAEESGWWDEDIWSEETLVSLGAEPPVYNAETDSYEIYTAEQILYLSGTWKTGDSNGDGKADAPCNGTYLLMNDIDMTDCMNQIAKAITKQSGTECTTGYMRPIAASTDENEEEGVYCGFFGTFDGQYHSISNLNITRMDEKYAGFFGNIGYDYGEGYVKNLALINETVTGKASCGLLAGAVQGDVDDVVCTGTIDCKEKTAGGLAGKIKKNDAGYESHVRNCFIYCDILVRGKGSENGAAGGLTAAQSNGGRAYNCYVGGSITINGKDADAVGGITGNLKTGLALEGMLMLEKSITTRNGTNIGLLCGSYGGESGSHLANNYVWEGTVVSGTVSSEHPENAAYTVVDAATIQTESFYDESLNWDMTDTWAWADGYPMLKGFIDNESVNAGLKERIEQDLTVTETALRSSEPLTTSVYEGDEAVAELICCLPEGVSAADAVLIYGDSKDPADFTESAAMEDQGNGTFSVVIPVSEVGTYYYAMQVTVGDSQMTYPSCGSIRIDVVSASQKYAPKYLTVAPGTTATSVGINFITQQSGLTGEVRYRVAGAGDWTAVSAEQYTAEIGATGISYESYSADLTGLTPDTQYEYMAVVTDGSNTYETEVSTFETLPDDGSFSFIVISDMQGTSEEAYKPFYYTLNGFVQDTLGGVDFIIHTGDMTEDDTQAEWGYLFSTIGETLSSNIVAYVAGNHEHKASLTYDNFRALTNLPGGVADETIGETTGSFVVGDVCFVILNTDPYSGVDGADTMADLMTYLEEQKAWAKQCFEESGCTWRVIMAHAGLIADSDEEQAFIEQMCDELDVDIYFNGHIHNYYRANVYEGKKSEVGTGTAYVTTSPMGLKFDDYPGTIDDLLVYQNGGSEDERQYLTYVSVTADGITVTAYQRATDEEAGKGSCVDYVAIDSFTLDYSMKPAKAAAEETETAAAEEQTAAPAEEASEQSKSAGISTGAIIGICAGCAVIAAVVVFIILRKKKSAK